MRTRRIGLIVAGPALALIAAACTSAAGGGEPTWTYAPASSAPASPTMDMSPPAGAPATSAGPASSGTVSAAPGPTGSSAATGAVLHISAQNIEFDTDHLDAPAGQPFVLQFDNKDPGVPHNVEIKNTNGTSVFKGEIITGPATAMYDVPALAPGSYMFVCDVHPNMTGTLTVN
jgi:plastocyanin